MIQDIINKRVELQDNQIVELVQNLETKIVKEIDAK